MENQHARYPAGDEPSGASASERACDVRDSGGGNLQFSSASSGAGSAGSGGAVFHPKNRLERFFFLSRRRLFQQRKHQTGYGHAASARHPSWTASESVGQSEAEDHDG